jgi:hypothetical protein
VGAKPEKWFDRRVGGADEAARRVLSPLARHTMTAISASLDFPPTATSLLEQGGGLHAGDVLGGKYMLLHPLGAGGMGQVWMAGNSATGAEVAVKALLPELASSGDALSLFRKEAHATAQLAHRGIVRIFDLVDLDPSEGSLLIVMELLRGHTLAERLEHQGALSIEETLAVALPILSALSHAHDAGVVHRDVKPDNVFLAIEPDGEVFPKLVDFGISQLREVGASPLCEGTVIGTPWYMSPEQARGEEVDARCDVFGVGILLYECLSGSHPFRVEGVMSSSFRRRPVPLGTIPVRLWGVIARALAERAEDRFSSAAELADALRAATAVRSGWTAWPSGSLITFYGATVALPRQRRLRALGVVAMALVTAAFVYGGGAPRAHAQESSRPRPVLMARAHGLVPAGRDVLLHEDGAPRPPPPAVTREPARSAASPPSEYGRCTDILRNPGF